MKRAILYITIFVSFCVNAQNHKELKASRMFFLDDEFGAMVISNQVIAITDNGGHEWKKVNIETNEKIRKLIFTSHQNGWLFTDSTLFNSIDGGQTWTINKTFNLNGIYSLTFNNSEVAFIGGRGIESTGHESIIYHTYNNGQSWNRSTIDTNMYDGISDISFANDSVGIAVAFYTIYKTNNSGLTWNKLPINFYVGSTTPGSGSMLDENRIILTCGFPAVVAEGCLFSSSDGGLTWSRFGGQSFKWGLRDEYILNQDSIWLTTGETTYFTEDAGENWDTLEVKLEKFSFTSHKQAFGLFDKYFYSTNDGWRSYSIIDSTATNIQVGINIPSSFKIYQNYPNPFNPTTTIKFELSQRDHVKIRVYNLLGEIITELFSGEVAAGIHEVIFNSLNLSSGIYLYQIETSSSKLAKKCILLK